MCAVHSHTADSSSDSYFSLSSWSKIDRKLRTWKVPLAVEKVRISCAMGCDVSPVRVMT